MNYTEVLNQNYHLQGFSTGGGFVYWSFTDSIVKTTDSGTVKCQREIKGGHLGDIDYFDGKIYGSYLGNALPGHEWDDWTSFKIYVFDADDLSVEKVLNIDVCDAYKAISETPDDIHGFRGIDGVTIAQPKGFSEPKLFVACALVVNKKYDHQIILQCDLEGKFETEYRVPTGNTVFGIQNLDFDASTGLFWFSTYAPEHPYQPMELLYCADISDCTVKEKYRYLTPYGFEAKGNDSFLVSLQSGKNGKRNGFCFEVKKEFFKSFKSEKELSELLDIKL